MDYPCFIKRDEADAEPAAYVRNELEHDAQLKGWGLPGLELADADSNEETVESLRAKLDEKGIAYSPRAGVKRLTELLNE